MTNLGSYLEHDGRPSVRLERHYPYPVARVWAAVTEPDELQHWFPSRVSYDAAPGGEIRFSGDPNVEDVAGTVLAFDPPHYFAFTWGENEVHLRLEAAGPDQCVLELTDVLPERDQAARNGAGWRVCLDELAKRLHGDASGGPHGESATPWQPIYEAYVAAGVPSGALIPTQ
jgi:uncharacterized protein YndB with AHSA1/START domain